jgi:hypothetical protein
MNATSITLDVSVDNQTYTVGDPALPVDLPIYTWYPTQSHVAWSYAVQTGPSFVTITSTPQISIQTTDGT